VKLFTVKHYCHFSRCLHTMDYDAIRQRHYSRQLQQRRTLHQQWRQQRLTPGQLDRADRALRYMQNYANNNGIVGNRIQRRMQTVATAARNRYAPILAQRRARLENAAANARARQRYTGRTRRGSYGAKSA